MLENQSNYIRFWFSFLDNYLWVCWLILIFYYLIFHQEITILCVYEDHKTRDTRYRDYSRAKPPLREKPNKNYLPFNSIIWDSSPLAKTKPSLHTKLASQIFDLFLVTLPSQQLRLCSNFQQQATSKLGRLQSPKLGHKIERERDTKSLILLFSLYFTQFTLPLLP